jgi:hypothetical protein
MECIDDVEEKNGLAGFCMVIQYLRYPPRTYRIACHARRLPKQEFDSLTFFSHFGEYTYRVINFHIDLTCLPTSMKVCKLTVL